MKKKFLSFILAVCFVIPVAFTLTACGDKPPETMTNAEMAATYKDVAKSTWSEIGVSDPTIDTSAAPLSNSVIPDKKQETSNASDLLQIKMNANNMASVLYLIGSLYENSNFALTNGVAKFDASVSIGQMQMSYALTLKPELDVENNKVYLEAYIVVNQTNEQYIMVEANYDFENETLLSFRIYTLSGGMYVDIEMTADNKNKFYATIDSNDTFSVAVNQEFESFKDEVENITKLTLSFDTEFQNYMTLLNKVITELMG